MKPGHPLRILIVNAILRTPEANAISQIDSIKDSMIYNFGKAFKAIGAEVTLLAAQEYKPSTEENYEIRVLFAKSFIKRIFNPAYLPLNLAVIRELKKEKYDLIISSEVFSMNTLLCSLFGKAPLIIWHELASHNKKMAYLPSKFWYNVIARIFFRRTRIVPRSEKAKEFISTYCKNVSNNCVLHGVDLNKFEYVSEKKDYLIVVCRLVKGKNVDSIIRKFIGYKDTYTNTVGKLLIVGDGDQKKYLQDLAGKTGRDKSIEFVGHCSHERLVGHLKYAKGMLIDTLKDNVALVISESIACGTPILTNTVPDNSNIVTEYDVGIVKSDWGTAELDCLHKNWKKYSDNAHVARESLSYEFFARKILSEI